MLMGFSQGTTLSKGEIAFTGYTSVAKVDNNQVDMDGFSFILLTDVEAETEIRFSDRGWNNREGGFAITGEDQIAWQANTSLPAGTILIVDLETASVSALNLDSGLSPGTIVTLGDGIDLNDQGDQLFAFQSTIDDPSLLAAIHMAGKWDPNTAQINTVKKSHLPLDLESGAFALAFDDTNPANPRNAIFNLPALSGTPAEILATLNDQNNWETSKQNEPPLDLTTQFEIALPIELTAFSAAWQKDHVLIQWSTASELNNDYMAVERSTDAESFREIGRVQGQGSTSQPRRYQLKDESPAPHLNYYRLRQVDFDGSVNYSDIVSVVIPENSIEALLYPVPAKDRITLQLGAALKKAAQLLVTGPDGRVWKIQQVAAGETQPRVDIHDLPAGNYFLELELPHGRQTFRFSKY